MFCTDQRGFKTLLQSEVEKLISGGHVMLNTRVKTIKHSEKGVSVVLADGKTLEADFALVSFSLGVLQHDDVSWEPRLPPWKEEAIQSMTMVRDFPLLYTICLTLNTGNLHKDLYALPIQFLV